jgi:large subunit ribosomal protein L15
MQIHDVIRENKNKKHVQIGRGGKRGKTSGRGHKGQKARAGHSIRPEWRDQIKKLPKLRGRGVNSNKSVQEMAQPVNVARIEEFFKAGDIVSPKTLLAAKLVKRHNGKLPRVKVLAFGEISKKVSVVSCEVSATAQNKIEKAGGSIKTK